MDGSAEARRQEESSGDTTEVTRRTLLVMGRHGIPVTPENYWVWFEYVIGGNEALVREIDAHIAEGAVFDAAQNRNLYEKYFGRDSARRRIRQISEATYRILKEAVESLIATGNLTQDYSQRLKGFLDHLEHEEPDAGGLKEIVRELILDTRRVEQSSSELSRQLEKAKQEANELRQRLEQVQREAIRDVLTGLYNRKYLQRAIEALHEQYRNEGVPYSVVMLDVDHFKRINDTFGHKVGDSVLEFIGHTITGSVKGRDVPVRYGGEEFLVLLPATTLENACVVADGIRRQVASKPLQVARTQEKIGVVRVSAGVAQVRGEDTVDSLIRRADKALYLAKQAGRDTVRSEKDLPAEADRGPVR